jgi:hypothetical protein
MREVPVPGLVPMVYNGCVGNHRVVVSVGRQSALAILDAMVATTLDRLNPEEPDDQHLVSLLTDTRAAITKALGRTFDS